MRYRLMATYRGVPYEVGIGPSNAEIVLFAACPPPEELGFEPATGHWRKPVIRAEIDALWESRPVGIYRGEPCIVLDDPGDRLHIAYLGTDAERATNLGYWQVDRGVFELLAQREEVTELVEERLERPLTWGEPTDGTWPQATYPYGMAPWPTTAAVNVPPSPDAAPPSASARSATAPMADPLAHDPLAGVPSPDTPIANALLASARRAAAAVADPRRLLPHRPGTPWPMLPRPTSRWLMLRPPMSRPPGSRRPTSQRPIRCRPGPREPRHRRLIRCPPGPREQRSHRPGFRWPMSRSPILRRRGPPGPMLPWPASRWPLARQ